MEVIEDHVHLFLEFHPSTSLAKVVQHLKGGSSYRLFKLYPELREKYWGGNLWSGGKFYRSVAKFLRNRAARNLIYRPISKESCQGTNITFYNLFLSFPISFYSATIP